MTNGRTEMNDRHFEGERECQRRFVIHDLAIHAARHKARSEWKRA